MLLVTLRSASTIVATWDNFKSKLVEAIHRNIMVPYVERCTQLLVKDS